MKEATKRLLVGGGVVAAVVAVVGTIALVSKPASAQGGGGGAPQRAQSFVPGHRYQITVPLSKVGQPPPDPVAALQTLLDTQPETRGLFRVVSFTTFATTLVIVLDYLGSVTIPFGPPSSANSGWWTLYDPSAVLQDLGPTPGTAPQPQGGGEGGPRPPQGGPQPQPQGGGGILHIPPGGLPLPPSGGGGATQSGGQAVQGNFPPAPPSWRPHIDPDLLPPPPAQGQVQGKNPGVTYRVGLEQASKGGYVQTIQLQGASIVRDGDLLIVDLAQDGYYAPAGERPDPRVLQGSENVGGGTYRALSAGHTRIGYAYGSEAVFFDVVVSA